MPRSNSLALEWPEQPSRSLHPCLGRRLRWRDRGRGFVIVRFTEQTGDYIACQIIDGVSHTLGRFSSLLRAKKCCQESDSQMSWRRKPR